MYRNKNSNNKFTRDLLAWGIVLAVMATVAAGDIEKVQIAKANVSEAIETADANTAGNAADSGQQKAQAEDVSAGKIIQSINFKKNVGIREALSFLAGRYQKNIIPSPSVDGQLAFMNLYDVTFEEAMDAILGKNFRYEENGNVIYVYTSEEYKKIKQDKERMMIKVFRLYYISAAEAMKLIDPVLSGAGMMKGSSPAEKLLPTGESISSGSSGGDTMALNDTIVILDYPENIENAEKLLKELDVRPKQVLVEATILSALLDEEHSLGIDWNTLNGTAIDTLANIGSGAADGLSTGGFASAVKTTISSGGLNVGVTNDHVAALIRAIESITDTTILANPKVLAVNKQLSQVYIGKKIGYQSQTTQTDTSTTQQVEFLETGTKLSFRPYIGDDGYIRMDIQPKDSTGTLKTNNIPDETSTELAANIIVKDGQTIIIGGLFRDNVKTTRNQVPLLGDIPLLGVLFRGTIDFAEREEVIVMLTPHIINEPQQTNGDARLEDISRKRYGARMALHGFSRTSLAEDHYAKAVSNYTKGNSAEALSELKSALDLRPTYFEALRLREKIIGEVTPNEVGQMERIMQGVIENEEAPNWRRY